MRPLALSGRAAEMRLRVLTGDPLFRTEVAGLTGALGHSIADDDGSHAGVTICDTGTVEFGTMAPNLDPLSTIVFLPSNPAKVPSQALLGAFIHVAPRTSVATELPRLLALLAE